MISFTILSLDRVNVAILIVIMLTVMAPKSYTVPLECSSIIEPVALYKSSLLLKIILQKNSSIATIYKDN
jgi:hypothetical protein